MAYNFSAVLLECYDKYLQKEGKKFKNVKGKQF